MTHVAQLTTIVATLDRPHALARCLDELLSGDVLPAEVVIVDQSRDDATRTMIEQRQVSSVRIVYIHRQQRGLSAARNAAIARAICPIIAVTDDDCVPDRGWVAALERAFASPDAPDAVAGRVVPLGPPRPGLYAVSSRKSTERAKFRGKALPWMVGTGGNFAVKREWYERIGGYDERLGVGAPGKAGEDMDLVYRLLRGGACIHYEPDAVMYHERQTKAQRLASRATYGYGIGAFCGIWLVRRDRYALYMLAIWLRWQGSELASALRGSRWSQVRERLLTLQGTMSGLIYGSTQVRGSFLSGVRKVVPAEQRTRLRQRLRRLTRPAWLGTLRRTTPISDHWGYDRGTPVDRYYIEQFLEENRRDIHGSVLEVKDSHYTDTYGSDVVHAGVLDIDSGNPNATIIADLSKADSIPSESFDCFILTQTLQLIYDSRAAIAHAHRILRRGGVLLVTVPALSRFIKPSIDEYWRFTAGGCRSLFGEAFGVEQMDVRSYGNVLTGVAFLEGLAYEELSRRELEAHDERFPLVIAVRAVKR